MNKNLILNEKQATLIKQTIAKNVWWSDNSEIQLDVWSNFRQSPDSLRNYLCKDGSGYIRGYYNGAGTLYVKRFHLRDEEWADLRSSQS